MRLFLLEFLTDSCSCTCSQSRDTDVWLAWSFVGLGLPNASIWPCISDTCSRSQQAVKKARCDICRTGRIHTYFTFQMPYLGRYWDLLFLCVKIHCDHARWESKLRSNCFAGIHWKRVLNEKQRSWRCPPTSVSYYTHSFLSHGMRDSKMMNKKILQK